MARLLLTNNQSLVEELAEEIGLRILHFCRRKDIPAALEFTWIRMCVDAYKKETQVNATEGTYVSSIAEGDTTVGYSQLSSSATKISSIVDEVTMNYKVDLLRYRKLSGLR